MDTSRGFPTSEYLMRLNKAQSAMAQHNLDALLLTTEPDVRYFTGYLTRFWESPSRPWFLVLPAVGKPIAVIPSIGAALMRQTWIEDICTWSAPDLEDDGIGLLGDTLDAVIGSKGGRVGLPAGQESQLRMPLGDFWRLQTQRPERSWVGDSNLLRSLRAVKSPAEIAKIQAACQVAGRAFSRLDSVLRPGLSQAQLFRRFQTLCLEEGADFVPYVAGGFGPWGYADVISPASDAPISVGDVVMLDTGLILDGYFADFDRNFAVARGPHAQVQDAYRRLIEATQLALDSAKPGMPICQLYQVMQGYLDPHGNTAMDSGRFGHGLGMQLTEWPSLIAAETTLLEPGMVLTLEPSVATDDKGHILVHEENIVITDTGATLLSPPASAELPLIEG